MLGLNTDELNAAFNNVFIDTIKELREEITEIEEVMGFHKEEFPERSQSLENQAKIAEEMNLTDREYAAVICQAIFKVIETNNMAIELQLRRAGISL